MGGRGVPDPAASCACAAPHRKAAARIAARGGARALRTCPSALRSAASGLRGGKWCRGAGRPSPAAEARVSDAGPRGQCQRTRGPRLNSQLSPVTSPHPHLEPSVTSQRRLLRLLRPPSPVPRTCTLGKHWSRVLQDVLCWRWCPCLCVCVCVCVHLPQGRQGDDVPSPCCFSSDWCPPSGRTQ